MYKYIGIFFLLIGLDVSAQITLIQYPLPTTQMKASDMFRADVLNTDNQTRQMYFVGTVTNTHNGQKVVSAKTQVIDVPPGSKQLNESLLQPAYLFQSVSAEQSGNLPYGNYEVCIDAFIVGAIEPTANACSEVELMPLSPPLLINPEHESTVHEDYPLLVWLPPMPIGKEKVLYDLKLVEMLPNQTAYDAIQRNFAILEKQNITGTTLQYPANAIKLEPDKQYAWKVRAVTGAGKPIGETEVWWFTIGQEKVEEYELPITKNFVKMKGNLDSYYVIVQNELKVIYEEKFASTKVKLTISDIKGKKIKELEFNAGEVGDNQFIIDLNIGGLKNRQFYILEASAPERPKQYLMFKNIK